MDLREIMWEVVDWIHLVQDRAVCQTCENVNELSASIKCEEFLD
jgi:hypothetical protein